MRSNILFQAISRFSHLNGTPHIEREPLTLRSIILVIENGVN